MRVGLIAPPFVPIPPPGYGGTESVVDNLARGLTRLGHEVVLFTVAESTCPVPRAHLFDRARSPIGDTVSELAHVLEAYERLGEVDVIHDHTVAGALVARRTGVPSPPVVVTCHGVFDAAGRRIFSEIARSAAVVAISRDHASRARGIPIAAVIHHGVDLDVYRPGGGAGEHLVFIGRMAPEKGVHRAVRIAHATGRPLRIVAKMRDAAEREYFETRVRPLLSAEDAVPEELPLAGRLELLQEAAGLLNPIVWPEPFGLVMAESLAAGTPVIATPVGAAPEIVTDRKTGFLCASERRAAYAVSRLDTIDRGECRRDAERRFSMERMALDYVHLYERVVDGPTPSTADQLSAPPLPVVP